jgi:hypothetical protein
MTEGKTINHVEIAAALSVGVDVYRQTCARLIALLHEQHDRTGSVAWTACQVKCCRKAREIVNMARTRVADLNIAAAIKDDGSGGPGAAGSMF